MIQPAKNAGGSELPWPAWRSWLACAAVALMPLSLNVGYYVLPDRKPLQLSPLDVLIGPLVLLLMWDVWRGRVRCWAPPLPNLAWAALALASYAWASGATASEWARSAVFQTTLVVLCAAWVFQHLAPDAPAHRRLALILGASLGLCVLYALYQYVQPAGLPLPSRQVGRYFGGGVTDVRVGGWYEFRGQLAAQVAMLVPAAAAFAALDRDPLVRVLAGALAALGLCVCLHGGGVLAGGVGVLVVAAALVASAWRANGVGDAPREWGPARKAGAIVAGLLLVAFVILPRLPRRNHEVLLRTLSPWVQAPGQDGEVLSARVRRAQAAWNRLLHKDCWKSGVGAGGYQSGIREFYDARHYPKPGANTDDEATFDVGAHEPFTFSQLETTAVELGLPGLIALACTFFLWVLAAGSAFWRSGPDQVEVRALALASLGAALGAGVLCFFGSPLVRGAGGTWAFFMGVALALNARTTKNDTPPTPP